MYRKNFIASLFVIAVFLTIGSFAAFAQTTAPIRGKVQLKKADGTIVPVADATITAYRIDIDKGKLPTSTTDKKGFFSFAGVPYAQLFVIVASAPGIRPGFYPNVKANMENIVIEVEEGNGEVPSEEDVRAAVAQAKTTPTTGEENSEDKKKREELLAKNKEIEAKNARIKNVNEIVNRSINEGAKAEAANDLNAALARYQEGYDADPTYTGTASVFLIKKANVLKNRAVTTYQKIVADPSSRASLIDSVKNDLQEAAVSSQKSFDMLKADTTTDAALAKKYEANKLAALTIAWDAYRLMIETRADENKAEDAVAAMDAYVAIETNAEEKTKAQVKLANALNKLGKSSLAVPIYKRLYEATPDNPDILGNYGLALFNSGVIASDKAQMQEGLNIMQRFSEVAPDTHPLKSSIKDAVDYLKNQEKLTPQKTTRPATTTTKKKN